MSLDTPSLQADALVDRRRLRRRLTFWRVLAFGFAAVAVTAITLRATGALTGGRQIARIEISGIITDNKDQIAMLRRLAKAVAVGEGTRRITALDLTSAKDDLQP